jgi:hypothetical protein
MSNYVICFVTIYEDNTDRFGLRYLTHQPDMINIVKTLNFTYS